MKPETYKRKEIKAMSWQALAGNWIRSVLLIFLFIIMNAAIINFLPLRIPFIEELASAQTPAEQLLLFMPESINTKTILSIIVAALLYLFIIPPFALGIKRFFLSVSRGRKPKIWEAFSVYANLKEVFSAMLLQIIMFVLLLLLVAALVLLFVPVFFVAGQTPLLSGPLLVVVYVLFLVSAVFLLLWYSRYTFATYILAEGKNGGAMKSFRACIALVRGRGKESIKLRASFFLWDLICSRVLPLSIVYQMFLSVVYAKYLDYFRGDIAFVEQKSPEA